LKEVKSAVMNDKFVEMIIRNLSRKEKDASKGCKCFKKITSFVGSIVINGRMGVRNIMNSAIVLKICVVLRRKILNKET